MASAARTHAAEFGMDLAERPIIAFGGAAPLHAARLGQKLGAPQIIIPPDAGVGSAVGFLLAPISYEVVRSRHQIISSLDAQLLNDLYAEMRSEALTIVKQASSQVNVTEERHAYMRYVGQGHEIKIEVPIAPYSELHRTVLEQAFEKAYTNLYGHLIQGVNIEFLSWALNISEPTTEQTRKPAPAPDKSVKPFSAYSIYETETSRRVNVPVYLRKDMTQNTFISGPALITEDHTTTMVSSNYDATFNELGCVMLTKKKLQGESID